MSVYSIYNCFCSAHMAWNFNLTLWTTEHKELNLKIHRSGGFFSVILLFQICGWSMHRQTLPKQCLCRGQKSNALWLDVSNKVQLDLGIIKPSNRILSNWTTYNLDNGKSGSSVFPVPEIMLYLPIFLWLASSLNSRERLCWL